MTVKENIELVARLLDDAIIYSRNLVLTDEYKQRLLYRVNELEKILNNKDVELIHSCE